MGGSIALIAAGKESDLFAGIISEAAHVYVDEMTLKGVGQAVVSYNMTNLKEKLFKYHGDKVDTVFKVWTNTWLSEGFRSWNIEHFLPQITCPTLVIQGDKDEYGEMAQLESIVSQVGGQVESLIVEGVGHTPHKESMEVVFEEVSRFIKDLL